MTSDSTVEELPEVLRELTELQGRLVGYLAAWREDPWSDWPTPPPPSDIVEFDDAYVVEIDLPGVEPHQVVISVTPGSVLVEGARVPDPFGGAVVARGRSMGPFRCSFEFDGPIDPIGTGTTLLRGVLRLRLPKAFPESERC